MDIEFERGKSYVVDRGEGKPRAGQGLLNGMGVIFRHFRDALTKKLDSPSETSGVFTVQYPEERMALPEAFRNFPILLYDDATGQELCTSCFQCERICPPQVIHMTQAHDPQTGKPVPALETFELEYDACMSCGLCAEVCPFDAIKMDHEFELSTVSHGELTIDRAGLARPISYYKQLAPRMWEEVEAGALKKLQGNIKRRSGLIGVAPPMRGSVAAQAAARPEPAEAPAPPAAAEGEPAPAPAEDKAARLAAIRAANAAKRAAAEAPAEPAEPDGNGAPAEPQSPADAKAARLAAIRAANAAKRAARENNEP